MLNDRIRRNIWLALTVMSVAVIIDRLVRVINGTIEWPGLLCALIISVFCTRSFLCYRGKLKARNR